MKKSILPFFILFSFLANAQMGGFGGGQQGPKITGKITGKLVDSLTNEAIGYATVVVLNAEFGKQVEGAITEESGKFKLSEIKPGKYNVEVSFLGYQPKTIKGITLTKKKPDANLKDIFLLPENYALEEVTVSAERSLIENKVDKLVYNAEQDVTNAGGTAADVLRKVPMLTVDIEGNVSLRGSQNIRILINGKPSGMFATSVKDALRLIPAEQIKQVEVITTPSAKYDGEGSGGIINIITKKKSVEGFSGSVDGALGTRQNNLVVSLNAAKGRFGINGSGSAYYSLPANGTFTYERRDTEEEGVEKILTQDGIYKSDWLGFNGRAGAFYDFNAFNSINSSISFNGRANSNDGSNTTIYNDPLNGFFQEYGRGSDQSNLFSGFDWTTDYKKTFKEKERELVLAYQLSGNTNNRENDVFQSDFPALDELNKNDGQNFEHTIQLDYTHPFSKKLKMEVGGKGVLRNIDSDYESFSFLTGAVDDARSDVFKYNQNVYAGYLSFNINFGKKYSLVAGARYESTQISGDFRDSDALDFEDINYDNFLPSIILSRNFKNFSALKLSYTKRIQRPSLFYINPYSDDGDRRNVTVGNPLLAPEIAHQVDLSYNTFINGTVIYASLYYKNTEDIIESFLQVNGDASVTTFRNVGTNQSLGLNVFSSKTIKIWTIRGNANVYSYQVSGNLNGNALKANALLYNFFVSSSLNFKKGWKVEMWGFWNSPRQTLQGRNPSFSMYSFGFKKDWGKRFSLGMNFVEPFHRNKSFISELEGPNFYQTSNFSIPFQSIGVNFSYRFGKLDFKSQKRRSSIKNNDLKQGEGGGGQQGGGGGGTGGN